MNRRSIRSAVLTVTFTFLASQFCFGADAAKADAQVFAPKLQHYVDDHVMAGAVVLVADKDQIQNLEAVGYSDLKEKRSLRVDDIFWIASMTKSMSAAAMMMLVDEGKVSLDDAVEKYIPEFHNVKVAQPDGSLVAPSHPIMIREILSHTSGFPFLNKKDRQVIDSVPLETSIKHDLLEPLLFDPGTKYSYSNEGIDTAGRIIEIVTGESYDKFLQDRLFTPLGMVDTTFHPSVSQLQRLAKSYRTNKDKNGLEEVPIQYLTNPLSRADRYPAPGGGLFSTAKDVCLFCQMLANEGTFKGKIYLSKAAVHQMTTKQTGPLVQDHYGFGLTAFDGTNYGHGGAYKTSMTVDHGQITVFLVQQASDWASGDPGRDFTTEVGVLNSKKTASAPTTLPETQAGMQVPKN